MPTVIAVYLGILRMVFQIPLPAPINTALKNMGACTSPLAMALVGSLLADTKLSELYAPLVFYLVAIRQLVLPLLTLFTLKLCTIETTIAGVSVILTSMPVGATTAIVAKKYGTDAEFASKCVFLSTVLSLVTVPFIFSLL